MENKKYYEYYYGKKVSQYALQYGFVDYRTLSDVVGGCVLCNAMESRFGNTLEHVSGAWYGKPKPHRLKIYYTSENAYIKLDGYRIPLDECIRTGG